MACVRFRVSHDDSKNTEIVLLSPVIRRIHARALEYGDCIDEELQNGGQNFMSRPTGSWAHYGGLFFKITHADLQNLDAAASLGLDHYTAAVRQSAGIKVYCEDKFGALVFLAFCLLVGVLIRGGGKSKYTQDYQL
ncbi:hypothetical protein BKA93DRAFT_830972 [Sparassis latifolia]